MTLADIVSNLESIVLHHTFYVHIHTIECATTLVYA